MPQDEASTFVAVYRSTGGLAGSRIVGVTADPEVVEYVARRILGIERLIKGVETDPATRALGDGRRRALRHIVREAADDAR